MVPNPFHISASTPMEGSNHSSEPVRYIRNRIANACDGCKARKVKCDGKLPCSYCAGRQRSTTCHYSPQRRRRTWKTDSPSALETRSPDQDQGRLPTSPPLSASESRGQSSRQSPPQHYHPRPNETPRHSFSHASAAGIRPELNSSQGVDDAARPRSTSHLTQLPEPSAVEDETEVPREARLLCDSYGKLTFIGDCAPLSFFQSVRRLVTSRVGPNAFAPQSSRFSVLENAPARQFKRSMIDQSMPDIRPVDIPHVVSSYLSITSALVDLFDNSKLLGDLMMWANLTRKPDNVTSIVHFLVFAIGLQADNEELSQQYFDYARDQAYSSLADSLGVETVQAFILVTIYMLCSSQINGAFLFFGIAARAGYSIGLHRTEVNARFGSEIHRLRDRLWKSIRALDLFLSSSMGRPTASSDVDCTVSYRALDADGVEEFDLLNASVQILIVLEYIVLEIYSKKKISMKMTEGISLQLREWSSRWLSQLKDTIAEPDSRSIAQVVGACQVLSSYYYAVMLVSRPFLMYELCRRLADEQPALNASALSNGKSKLADACIDAASMMVDPILDLIERGMLHKAKAPLLVSWLFASSLVLGVGLLGGFGRILEKYMRMSIQAMDHFAQSDAHAKQYSLIAQSLLTTSLEYLEWKELEERLRRTENSSQLFGLVASDVRSPRMNGPARQMDTPLLDRSTINSTTIRSRPSLDESRLRHHHDYQVMASPRRGDVDPALMGMSEGMMDTPDTTYWDSIIGNDNDPNSALNLFPLLEAGGGIDLTHWL